MPKSLAEKWQVKHSLFSLPIFLPVSPSSSFACFVWFAVPFPLPVSLGLRAVHAHRWRIARKVCGRSLAKGVGLCIHRRCGRLVETLPALQHDPNRPEDVLKVDADEDGVGGDDAAEALRYLVATKPREVVMRKLRGL
jgi:hypothetical protein